MDSGVYTHWVLSFLSAILNSAPAGSLDAQKIRAKIWELELLEILLVNIQQDASKIRGSWDTLDKLAKILR